MARYFIHVRIGVLWDENIGFSETENLTKKNFRKSCNCKSQTQFGFNVGWIKEYYSEWTIWGRSAFQKKYFFFLKSHWKGEILKSSNERQIKSFLENRLSGSKVGSSWIWMLWDFTFEKPFIFSFHWRPSSSSTFYFSVFSKTKCFSWIWTIGRSVIMGPMRQKFEFLCLHI